jgi:hypothetical protein
MPSVCGCEFISMCYLKFWDSRLHEAWYKTVVVIAHPNNKLYNFLKSETTLWAEICAAGCIMNTTVKVTCCGIVTMKIIRLAPSFCVVATLRLRIAVPLASWMYAKCPCLSLLSSVDYKDKVASPASEAHITWLEDLRSTPLGMWKS